MICAECGEPVSADPFGAPGVVVHDVDELGARAIDLDEDHAPVCVKRGGHRLMCGAWALFTDGGWGDWRLVDNIATRVTVKQVEVIAAMSDVEDVGASEVRFGEMTGELTVLHVDGRITHVAEDGGSEPFEEN